MAAGLVTLRSGGAVHVRSAGSDPAEDVNPGRRKRHVARSAVDLGDAFPKPLTDEVVRAADVVITMGCGDACPIYPGKRYEDWQRRRSGRGDVRSTRCGTSATTSTRASGPSSTSSASRRRLIDGARAKDEGRP